MFNEFSTTVFPYYYRIFPGSECKPACLCRQQRTAYKSLDEISLSYTEFERNKEKTRREGGRGGGGKKYPAARNFLTLET